MSDGTDEPWELWYERMTRERDPSPDPEYEQLVSMTKRVEELEAALRSLWYYLAALERSYSQAQAMDPVRFKYPDGGKIIGDEVRRLLGKG